MTISIVWRFIKNQDKQLSEIDKLQKTGKEKEQFEFKDQQNVKDFVESEKQDEMMKEFAKKMKDNLDQLKTIPKDELKEDLKALGQGRR
jgi:uncharacterized protein (UPF0264 family)